LPPSNYYFDASQNSFYLGLIHVFANLSKHLYMLLVKAHFYFPLLFSFPHSNPTHTHTPHPTPHIAGNPKFAAAAAKI
jgi:hypothetical protein